MFNSPEVNFGSDIIYSFMHALNDNIYHFTKRVKWSNKMSDHIPKFTFKVKYNHMTYNDSYKN